MTRPDAPSSQGPPSLGRAIGEPPVAYAGRQLGRDDLPALVALQAAGGAELPPEPASPDPERFLAGHPGDRGRILGLFHGAELIAFGALDLPRPGEPGLADKLPEWLRRRLAAGGAGIGNPPGDRGRIAEFHGAGVRPDLRGKGLHRMTIAWRLAEAARAGCDVALAVAALGDPRGIANLLDCGFAAVALVDPAGHPPRFLMYRAVRSDLPPPGEADLRRGRWLKLDDLKAQRDLLASGWVGTRLDGDAKDARRPFRVFYLRAR